MPNRLINETSPYLLQHAHNPVDWYPYGEEAFEKARTENKPMLFSIGYASCHWCHVMERESFENEAIATVMNEAFVCVKVDREERPDVDHFYMDAVQLLYGHGGWPLNCFATPDGKPFWGGTYFKPEQWKDILKNVSGLFKDQNRDFLDQAREVTEHLMKSGNINKTGDNKVLDAGYFDEVLYLLRQQFDPANGGLSGAPKFPMPLVIQLLLQYYYAFGKQDTYQQALLTMRNMAKGGIFDQVGGGFARYSVDNRWKVPHFEKMLYDNALLVSLYCNAYRITKDEAFKDIIEGTLDFIKSELTSPEGLFYSSLDADSEGEEGHFYTWTKTEFDIVLGQYSDLIAEYFGMGESGHWEEGRCTLYRNETDAQFAQRHFLSEEELRALVISCRVMLMEIREHRQRPGLDDKIVLSWNALMIRAYTDAYATLGNSEYLGIALNAARVLGSLLHDPEGGLFHTWKNGKARIAGFLDDYTFFADACLGIYQMTLDNSWLAQAESYVKYAITQFADTESGLFFFSEQKHHCIVRKTETYDSVVPSSNSAFARLLHSLGTLTGKTAYIEICDSMLSVMTEKISNYPTSYANWVILAMERSLPFFVIAVVGEDAHEKLQELGKHYIPYTLIAGSTIPGDMPYIRNRFVAGKTLFHICNENSCFAPVDSVDKAIDLLRISSKLVD
jgi:uncharacterized protein